MAQAPRGRTPLLLDRLGNPVDRTLLRREVAVPTTMGLRNPLSGYPGDGLSPVRLAAILREADMGEPLRYFELAETIEERDLHYAGVLGTRRRSVSQIDITVEAASDSAEDEARATRVRDWLRRDELTEEVFDILDCIGKGVSFTEIIWDTSAGQWQPVRLEWRDPRWFGVDRLNLSTPVMKGETGLEEPLPAFKFISAAIKAKSGLPLRSGLSRIAMWGYLFKKYTERDWAMFTQTYGQPLRLGRWHEGASEEDKETLFRAVANIAGDCAAIIPEQMQIEFIETGSVSATGQLYKERADWIDQQVSKCVLGQTATTDAVTGGLGSGREHRQVQEDIERADAKALAAILNRDLIRPWMQLEFGRLDAWPRLVIARAESIDIARVAAAVAPMIDRGLRVSQKEIRDKFGLAEPVDGEEVLQPAPRGLEGTPGGDREVEFPRPTAAASPDVKFKRVSGVFKRGSAATGHAVALNASLPSTGVSAALAPGAERPAEDPHQHHEAAEAAITALADRLQAETAPAVEAMLGPIEAMIAAAGSLEELREMLLTGFDQVDESALAQVLGQAMVAAWGAGRVAVEEEAGG